MSSTLTGPLECAGGALVLRLRECALQNTVRKQNSAIGNKLEEEKSSYVEHCLIGHLLQTLLALNIPNISPCRLQHVRGHMGATQQDEPSCTMARHLFLQAAAYCQTTPTRNVQHSKDGAPYS